jgi:hypothetical protein
LWGNIKEVPEVESGRKGKGEKGSVSHRIKPDERLKTKPFKSPLQSVGVKTGDGM